MNPSLDLPIPAGRLADGGPVYTETNLDRLVAEPFNAVTALPFLILAIYWLVRLRGQWKANQFMVGLLVLLAVGGVGGTLYHAFRVSRVFFLMDVLPIVVLGLALAIYFWLYVLPRRWLLLPVIMPFIFAHRAMFSALPPRIAVNASYAMIAACILVPLFLALRKDHWVDWGRVAAAVGLFGTALAFRYLDGTLSPWLPMGTHWLWHTFGALSVTFLTSYVVRFSARNVVAAFTATQRVQ